MGQTKGRRNKKNKNNKNKKRRAQPEFSNISTLTRPWLRTPHTHKHTQPPHLRRLKQECHCLLTGQRERRAAGRAAAGREASRGTAPVCRHVPSTSSAASCAPPQPTAQPSAQPIDTSGSRFSYLFRIVAQNGIYEGRAVRYSKEMCPFGCLSGQVFFFCL